MKKSAQLSLSTGPAPIRVQIAGLSFVALILAIVAIWNGVHAFKLDKDGIRTSGIVVGSEKSSESSYPVFEFADTFGRTHTVRAAVSSGNYLVGSTIPIIYPEDRPLTARVDDKTHLYALTLITGLMSGAFFLAVGALFKFRAAFQGIFAAKLGKLRVSRSGLGGKDTQQEYSSEPLLTWISRIFGTGAVLLACAAIWAGWQSYEFVRSGVETKGLVVELVRRGRNHEVHVQFEDSQGSSYRAGLPDRSNDYLVGDRIPLIYPMGNPRGIRLQSSSVLLGWPGYFTLLAFVFVLVTTMTRIQLAEIEKARRSAASEK